MAQIEEIFKVTYMKNGFEFVGSIRNERQFNLGDKVFFRINEDQYSFGRIVGIELLPTDNPEYKYKITVPKSLVNDSIKDYTKYDNVTCERIYFDISEAKNNAIDDLNKRYNLDMGNLNRYFDQFSET